jgi:hypothetical protein
MDAVRLAGFTPDFGQDVRGGAPAAALAATLTVLARVHDVAELPPRADLDAGDLFALLLAGVQVADVAVACQHAVVRAQVLVDRLGLGRGFDDDEIVITATVILRGGFGRRRFHRRLGFNGCGGLLACRCFFRRGGRFGCRLLAWRWHS